MKEQKFTYDLSSLDYLSAEDFQRIVEEIDKDYRYTMGADADLWEITYLGAKFTIVYDIPYGPEIVYYVQENKPIDFEVKALVEKIESIAKCNG